MTAVDPAALDLAACAEEPIHAPGSVQPHGVLVALEEPSLRIGRVSANAESLLGVAPGDLLGRTLGEVVDGLDAGSLATDDLATVNPFRVTGTAGPLDAVAHRTGGYLVVELEEAGADGGADPSAFHRLRGSLERLQAATTLEELTARAATEVRRLTGFDRVMVYRFDEHWNGEVVAEDRDERLEPFLGLHYPASDIPAQARDLYARSWLRLIVDRDYRPVPLLPDATDAGGAPLDLSGSVLRSVAPVHLEYLRNMGVVASMSISLLERDRLWGLIACHHTSGPLRPSLRARAGAEFLGRTVSLLLPSSVTAGDYERGIAIRAAEARIAERLGRAERASGALLEGDELLEMTGATGVVLRLEGRVAVAGEVPPPEVAEAIVARLLAGGAEVATDACTGVAEVEVAAGALVARVGASADQWILCLRPEVLSTITWSGDPREKVRHGADRIGPRQSFAAWSETVRGASVPWNADEVAAVRRVARHTSSMLLQRAQAREALAATLHRTLLLEELPEVPGLDLAVRYQPAHSDALGGDWYDVFWLPEGRVALAVGDVAGHGMTVAPVMAHLRHGLRAYLLKEADPGAALARLNELAAALLPADLASVVVADFVPATGALRVANAGHPPALVVGASRSDVLSERGPALGVLTEHRYPTSETVLGLGDAVVLYSDGLFERRSESLDVGIERVRSMISASTAPLDAACEELLGQATGDDDVTVLALRRT